MWVAPSRREKTLTKALVLTDGEAGLLYPVLDEVKTKTFEESRISLDDLEALNALVSHFREVEKVEPDKEACQTTIGVSKKTHADFEKYRATLSAERKKVQTHELVVKALLEMATEQPDPLVTFASRAGNI